MNSRFFTVVLAAVVFFTYSVFPARADQRDDEITFLKSQIEQLQKRIEKLEAGQLAVKNNDENKAAQQNPQQIRELVQEEVAEAKKQLLPQWLESIKLKGDFRLRYEWDKDKGQNDNNRARIRARLGLEAKVNDKMSAGAGITTGRTNDPRSTNVTLGSSSSANTPASAKDIVLNYAYGEYRPCGWITLTAGKFKNPLWLPADMLWDPDINPEGFTTQFKYDLNSNVSVFMNNLFFVLRNDNRNSKQAYMHAIQPGAVFGLGEDIQLKSAVTYYGFSAVKGEPKFSTYNGTNTLVGNNYKYDYEVISPAVEIGIKEPFEGLLPYAAVFGEFADNFDVSDGGKGFDAGLRFGSQNIDGPGKWQARIVYVVLEKDAWLDIFPESSRYSGKTNIRGIDGVIEYGIAKNSTIAAHYYYSKSMSSQENPEHVLQLDWNLRF